MNCAVLKEGTFVCIKGMKGLQLFIIGVCVLYCSDSVVCIFIAGCVVLQ
jgi:hypothetical protein